MHERRFDRQNDLDPYHLAADAAEFGSPSASSDLGGFEAGPLSAERGEENVEGSLRGGVRGTPTIVSNGRRPDGDDGGDA